MLKSKKMSLNFKQIISAYSPNKKYLTFQLLLVVLVSVSTFFSVNYILECLNPTIYPKVGWYISKTTENGTRILGGLGIYYTILTFILTTISIMGLLSFFPLFTSSLEIASSFNKKSQKTELDFRKIKENLILFSNGYLIAKLLAAIYMLNAFTWKWEKPQGSFNIIIMGSILTFFGIFFISIPRYYIEYEWHKYKIEKYKINKDEKLLNYDDIRPFKIKLIVHFVDTIIIGSFIGSFWM